jgi:putative heme-binding domain-containing protein
MQREKVPVRTDALTRWLGEERDEAAVAVLLESLAGAPAAETRAALEAVVGEKDYGITNRLRALALVAPGLGPGDAGRLLDLARALEDGPVLAEVLRQLARFPDAKPAAVLTARVGSASPEVRAAIAETLGALKAPEGKDVVLKLLADEKPEVRRVAAGAAGNLAVKEAAETLLKLARDSDAGVRVASLGALRRLKEPRAVSLSVAALDDRATQFAALELLGELGGPEHGVAVTALARRAPPADVLALAVRSLSGWADRDRTTAAKRHELKSAVAEVHGATGMLLLWQISDPPLTGKDAEAARSQFAAPGAVAPPNSAPVTGWRTAFATAAECRLNVGPTKGDAVRLALTDVAVAEPTHAEFTASGAAAEVWLNGKLVYRAAKPPDNRSAPARFTAELAKGHNRVLVRVASPGTEFSLNFRRKSSTAAHEKLTQRVLAEAGNVERGRKVFLDAEKSLCIKCHRVGDQGERIGPELTGIGARFGRVYLVESILDPNRAVVPGFATLRIELKDGRVFTGVKSAETDTTMTLADNEAKQHELKKADVFEQRPVGISTMPEGAEKRLTEQEFIDLVAYLVSLKERNSK